MIYKLLMMFFTVFSHVFANEIVTDQNSHCSFDVRNVKYIGIIEIDIFFVKYVLKNNRSYLWLQKNTTGKNLQEYLLNHIQEAVSMETKCDTTSEVYQYVYNLIHHEFTEEESTIRIRRLILSLVTGEFANNELE